ncbi:hypothetical protein BT69DRAFT_55392 [Atractiella rhizophila]|nr:hypothetical protein BT69DRAFT_55392 [Atractiella rhizophila]
MSTKSTVKSMDIAYFSISKGFRKRKHRQALSCEHCRKRRMRCDRQIQCGSCTTKGLTCVWEEGVFPTVNAVEDINELRQTITELRAQLAVKRVSSEKEESQSSPKASEGGLSPPSSMSPSIETCVLEKVTEDAVLSDFVQTLLSLTFYKTVKQSSSEYALDS